MSRPLLSVIIPSFNHGKYLESAVLSVLNQTVTNLELLVIDDGSSDDSAFILKRFRDSRIRLTFQENRGAHHAINLGLEQARGRYLAILNSDDLFERNRFEIMFEQMDSDQTMFSCSWLTLIDSEGKTVGTKKGWGSHLPAWAVGSPQEPITDSEAVAEGVISREDFLHHLFQSNFISTTTNMLFHRNVYETVGGMAGLRFCHDWDFALRVAKRFPCSLVNEPLARYRIHSGNTIRTNELWMNFEIAWIYAVHLESQSHGDTLNKEHEAITAVDVEEPSQDSPAHPEVDQLVNSEDIQQLYGVLVDRLGDGPDRMQIATEYIENAALRGELLASFEKQLQA